MPHTGKGFVGEYDNSTFSIGGIELAYHDEGSEENALTFLLLHGLNGHSGTWRRVIPEFAKSVRIIAPSLPPWHGSPLDLDISKYVALIDALMSGLRIGGKLVIVGNSMGGWIGMRLASKSPQITRALVLEDSAGIGHPSDGSTIEKLDSSGTPVLIIWGRNDHIISVKFATEAQARIRHSKLHIFEGVGHVPHWEKPAEFVSVVQEFISLPG